MLACNRRKPAGLAPAGDILYRNFIAVPALKRRLPPTTSTGARRRLLLNYLRKVPDRASTFIRLPRLRDVLFVDEDLADVGDDA
jgi:hypothetical protein